MLAFVSHGLFFHQKKQVVRKQGGKKKKQILKFTLDCTHPVEDGIMDAANFVSSTVSVDSTRQTLSFNQLKGAVTV